MEDISLNKKLALFLVSLFLCFFVAKADALAGASFSLSPSTGVCIPGGTFDLDIVLQSDEPASGATAIIDYDPSILQALTLTNGTIFPIELFNSIDSAAGEIRLDTGVNPANPDYHTGSGVFGVIKFKVLQVGSASLSFDFTPGDTKDSNVAHTETHQDILTSVSGGSYTFEEINTDASLDPSCVSGEGPTPTPTPSPTPTLTPTPTPTPTTPPGATPTPTTPPDATPTPTTPPGATPTTAPAAGGAPEGGIIGPTVLLSLLGLLMIGAGLVL